MSALRTLIVDDEPVARDLLARRLARLPSVVHVGSCANGLEALDALRCERVDLALLDVRMPGLDGFEVVERLAPGDRPAIVFTTAYDEFALRAFDVHAIDYLLKPIDDDRLVQALERVRRRRDPPGWKSMQARLSRFLAGRGRGSPDPSWLVARQGDRRVPLRWEEIVWLEAAGNYVRVHTAGAEFLLRSTLTELEERLADLPFLRVHRGTLVNVARIVSLRPIGHGDFRVRVAGGAELTLSRRYRARVEAVLGRLG